MAVRVGKSTQAGIRTQDQLVKSQLLYQLSYLRVGFGCAVFRRRGGKVVEGDGTWQAHFGEKLKVF